MVFCPLVSAIESVVGPATIDKFLVVPGKIRTNPDKTAHVSPRYEGLVSKVLVSSGDWVEKGAILARIERNIGVSSYTIRSPIKGIVLHRSINPGDPVKEDQEAFQISDLSTLWASMFVKASEISNFQSGKGVSIHSLTSNESVSGVIHFVSPVVDPETRTILVAATILNENRNWLPGKIIDGHISLGSKNVPLAIPIHAVKQELGRFFTYQRQGKEYIKTYLRLGVEDKEHAEVLRGLSSGAVVTSSRLSAKRIEDESSHDEHSEHSHDGEGERHGEHGHSESENHKHEEHDH